MRFAVLSDIHANIHALEATLKDARKHGCESILCLGDLVGYGPNPAETMDLAYSDIDYFILGNHDAVIGNRLDSDLFNDRAKAIIEWTRSQLSDDAAKFFADMPLEMEGEGFLGVHAESAVPGRFNYLYESQDTVESFQARPSPLTFIGHTHLPAYFRFDPSAGAIKKFANPDLLAVDPAMRYIVNAGSVGDPRDGRTAASYCIYDVEKRQVIFRQVPFDIIGFRDNLLRTKIEVKPYFLGVYEGQQQSTETLRDMIVDVNKQVRPLRASPVKIDRSGRSLQHKAKTDFHKTPDQRKAAAKRSDNKLKIMAGIGGGALLLAVTTAIIMNSGAGKAPADPVAAQAPVQTAGHSPNQNPSQSPAPVKKFARRLSLQLLAEGEAAVTAATFFGGAAPAWWPKDMASARSFDFATLNYELPASVLPETKPRLSAAPVILLLGANLEIADAAGPLSKEAIKTWTHPLLGNLHWHAVTLEENLGQIKITGAGGKKALLFQALLSQQLPPQPQALAFIAQPASLTGSAWKDASGQHSARLLGKSSCDKATGALVLEEGSALLDLRSSPLQTDPSGAYAVEMLVHLDPATIMDKKRSTLYSYAIGKSVRSNTYKVESGLHLYASDGELFLDVGSDIRVKQPLAKAGWMHVVATILPAQKSAALIVNGDLVVASDSIAPLLPSYLSIGQFWDDGMKQSAQSTMRCAFLNIHPRPLGQSEAHARATAAYIDALNGGLDLEAARAFAPPPDLLTLTSLSGTALMSSLGPWKGYFNTSASAEDLDLKIWAAKAQEQAKAAEEALAKAKAAEEALAKAKAAEEAQRQAEEEARMAVFHPIMEQIAKGSLLEASQLLRKLEKPDAVRKKELEDILTGAFVAENILSKTRLLRKDSFELLSGTQELTPLRYDPKTGLLRVRRTDKTEIDIGLKQLSTAEIEKRCNAQKIPVTSQATLLLRLGRFTRARELCGGNFPSVLAEIAKSVDPAVLAATILIRATRQDFPVTPAAAPQNGSIGSSPADTNHFTLYVIVSDLPTLPNGRYAPWIICRSAAGVDSLYISLMSGGDFGIMEGNKLRRIPIKPGAGKSLLKITIHDSQFTVTDLDSGATHAESFTLPVGQKLAFNGLTFTLHGCLFFPEALSKDDSAIIDAYIKARFPQ